MHTVVPGVLAVAGVLNGALVTAEELGKFPESWNGSPIPILHPEQDGEPISANYPDILERAAGTIFGATLDGDRLRAELWLDETRFDEMGQSALLAAMAAGEMVEVSTGYYADTLVESGTFNGKPYRVRHANIRPDHLALLPGQTGACSIADGCGAPRVNTDVDKGRIASAVSNLLVTLGLKPNDCQCEEPTMNAAAIAALAKKLHANGADLGDMKANFDIAELEKMSDVTRAALGAALKQLDKSQAKAAEDDEAAKAAAKAAANEGDEDEGDEDEEGKAMKKNAAAGGEKPITRAELKAMMAETLAEAIKPETINAMVERAGLEQRILANSACAFEEAELKAMSLEALTKYEKSIRPVDYSGAGGYVPSGDTGQGGGAPLMVNSGLMSADKKGADKATQ